MRSYWSNYSMVALMKIVGYHLFALKCENGNVSRSWPASHLKAEESRSFCAFCLSFLLLIMIMMENLQLNAIRFAMTRRGSEFVS
jgi:hypothetical protein